MKVWTFVKCFFANLFPENPEYLFRDELKALRLKPSKRILLEHADEDLHLFKRFLEVEYDVSDGTYTLRHGASFEHRLEHLVFSDLTFNLSEDGLFDRTFERGYRLCTRDEAYMTWLKASVLEEQRRRYEGD